MAGAASCACVRGGWMTTMMLLLWPWACCVAILGGAAAGLLDWICCGACIRWNDRSCWLVRIGGCLCQITVQASTKYHACVRWRHAQRIIITVISINERGVGRRRGHEAIQGIDC